MTISRVEIQGQITRAQDFTNIKHNEDNKGAVEQAQITDNSDRAVELRLHHVNSSQNADNMQKKMDAKEEGSNQYQGDGGKNRKNKKEPDGKVIVKGKPSGFDLKI